MIIHANPSIASRIFTVLGHDSEPLLKTFCWHDSESTCTKPLSTINDCIQYIEHQKIKGWGDGHTDQLLYLLKTVEFTDSEWMDITCAVATHRVGGIPGNECAHRCRMVSRRARMRKKFGLITSDAA